MPQSRVTDCGVGRLFPRGGWIAPRPLGLFLLTMSTKSGILCLRCRQKDDGALEIVGK